MKAANATKPDYLSEHLAVLSPYVDERLQVDPRKISDDTLYVMLPPKIILSLASRPLEVRFRSRERVIAGSAGTATM